MAAKKVGMGDKRVAESKSDKAAQYAAMKEEFSPKKVGSGQKIKDAPTLTGLAMGSEKKNGKLTGRAEIGRPMIRQDQPTDSERRSALGASADIDKGDNDEASPLGERYGRATTMPAARSSSTRSSAKAPASNKSTHHRYTR